MYNEGDLLSRACQMHLCSRWYPLLTCDFLQILWVFLAQHWILLHPSSTLYAFHLRCKFCYLGKEFEKSRYQLLLNAFISNKWSTIQKVYFNYLSPFHCLFVNHYIARIQREQNHVFPVILCFHEPHQIQHILYFIAVYFIWAWKLFIKIFCLLSIISVVGKFISGIRDSVAAHTKQHRHVSIPIDPWQNEHTSWWHLLQLK